MRSLVVPLLIAVVAGAGCAALAGLDRDYVVGATGGTGGTAAGSTSSGGSSSGGATSTGATGGGGTGGMAGAGGGGVVSYVDVVLADGPLAFWRFGEDDGATAFDSSGYGRHAAYSGNVDHTVDGAIAGDPDNAVGFPGANAGVQHELDFDDFHGTAPYTLEVWFRSNAPYDGTHRHLYNKDLDPDGGGNRHNIGLFVHDTDRLGFERIIDDDKHQAAAALPVIGTWVHVVGTYDGSTLRIYVDGAIAETTPDDRTQAPKPVRSYIGTKGPSFGVLDGSLDEFAIYDYALPVERIQAHHDAGVGR